MLLKRRRFSTQDASPAAFRLDRRTDPRSWSKTATPEYRNSGTASGCASARLRLTEPAAVSRIPLAPVKGTHGLVSGHGFSRAARPCQATGFSPCRPLPQAPPGFFDNSDRGRIDWLGTPPPYRCAIPVISRWNTGGSFPRLTVKAFWPSTGFPRSPASCTFSVCAVSRNGTS